MTDKKGLLDEDEEFRQKYPDTSPGTSGSSKTKKYVIIGLITLLVLAGAGVGVYFLIIKKDDPVDPVDPTVYYDPYEVEATDPATGTYTIKRNTKLNFDYPYQESTNNKFVDSLQLQGQSDGAGFNLYFTDLGLSDGSAAP